MKVKSNNEGMNERVNHHSRRDKIKGNIRMKKLFKGIDSKE